MRAPAFFVFSLFHLLSSLDGWNMKAARYSQIDWRGGVMAIKKRIKGKSALTRELLSEGESVRADFKRQPDGINAEDLVSFANSEGGGQILAGIDEQAENGAQIGVVRGCDVSDAAVLQILNKAVSCIPPVSLDVYIENLSDKPILRVEVQPSATKPHCTPKGIYCRRDGTRNRPLHPSELLRIFLDSEASAFASRFEAAAERITAELGELEASLEGSIKSMSDQLGWAEYQLGDTESTLDNIQSIVAKLTVDTAAANSRLRTIFRQDKRDDPVRKKARIRYANDLLRQIEGDKALLSAVLKGTNLEIKDKQPEDGDLTNQDVEEILKLVMDHIRQADRDKKYDIVVKSPKSCSDEELDRFAEKVAEGGEVALGVRGRVERAFRLGFIIHDGAVVGTAALKKPTKNYREKVFRSAKSSLNFDAYPYELGWIFLDVPHRKKGQMTRSIGDILEGQEDLNLFATARSSNDVMQDMLLQLKFIVEGSSYESSNKVDETIKLYVRNVENL